MWLYALFVCVVIYALFICVVIVLVNETAAARGGALSGNSLTAVIGKSTYLYLSIFATYNHMLLNLSKYAIWRSLKIFPMWEGERRRTNHIEKRLTIFRHAGGAAKTFCASVREAAAANDVIKFQTLRSTCHVYRPIQAAIHSFC